MRPESGFRIAPNWPQFEKWKWRHKWKWRCFVSLVNFSYWYKFHVNIITGSGVMTISFYKGLTRNLEIGNTPVWVLSNIWRELGIPNLARTSLIKCYWMLQNAKVTSHFWFIKRKPTGGREENYPPPPSPPRKRKRLIK